MTVTSSIPVLRVSNFDRARSFWRDVLRYKVIEEAGEPASFGIFRRDVACVFLISQDGPEAPYDGWRAYFHVDDADEIAARLDAAELPYTSPTITAYRMREIEVTDPDGNVVCFGQDVP